MKNCQQCTQVASLDSHIPSRWHIPTTMGHRATIHTNSTLLTITNSDSLTSFLWLSITTALHSYFLVKWLVLLAFQKWKNMCGQRAAGRGWPYQFEICHHSVSWNGFGNLLIVPGMQRKKEEQKYLEVRIDKVRASTQNIMCCFCRLSKFLENSPDPGENVGDDLWLTNYTQVNEILGMVPPLVHGRDVSRMVSASCLQSIRAIHISGHIRTSRVPQSDSHYLIAMND